MTDDETKLSHFYWLRTSRISTFFLHNWIPKSFFGSSSHSSHCRRLWMVIREARDNLSVSKSPRNLIHSIRFNEHHKKATERAQQEKKTSIFLILSKVISSWKMKNSLSRLRVLYFFGIPDVKGIQESFYSEGDWHTMVVKCQQFSFDFTRGKFERWRRRATDGWES